MSSLQTLNNNESGLITRGKINDNFTALNTDKAELSGATFTGDISVPAEVYGAGWNGSNEVPTKNDLYDKIETLGSGSVATDAIWDAKGDLAGGTGANTASRLAVGSNGQVLTADSAEATGLKWTNPAGGGDALTSGTLAQFASTTSAQLATVISDETGSGGVLVFSNSPALTTPSIAAITVSGGVLTLPTGASGTIARTSDITGTNSGTNTGDETTGRINTLYGTTNAITVGSVEVGHATDTTISRVSAGKIAVEGVNVGTEGILQNSQSAAYTLVLTDAGKSIYHPSADTTARTWTIPANASVAFPIGTAVTFINSVSAGTITISITTDTLRLAGAGTTGSRTLTQNGLATAIKVNATEWYINGTNLS